MFFSERTAQICKTWVDHHQNGRRWRTEISFFEPNSGTTFTIRNVNAPMHIRIQGKLHCVKFRNLLQYLYKGVQKRKLPSEVTSNNRYLPTVDRGELTILVSYFE